MSLCTQCQDKIEFLSKLTKGLASLSNIAYSCYDKDCDRGRKDMHLDCTDCTEEYRNAPVPFGCARICITGSGGK